MMTPEPTKQVVCLLLLLCSSLLPGSVVALCCLLLFTVASCFSQTFVVVYCDVQQI
jgi:hypothetical protein